MSEYFDDLLSELVSDDRTTAEKYREDIIGYFKDIQNTTFPPKHEFFLRKMYQHVLDGQALDIIFKSPRGGGKSKLASAFEHMAWYALDAETVNCGGSEEQAKIVFEYVKSYIDRDQDAKAQTSDKLITTSRVSKAGLKPQPTLMSVPASPKSIRGKHPGGETKTAGILCLDEMVEMENDIVQDALGMLKGCPVPITVCFSTFHKMYGKFQEFWDSKNMGFVKFDWDAFDVCETCHDACDDCVPEFVEKYCRVICGCYFDFERDPDTLPKWSHFHYERNSHTGAVEKKPGDIGKFCRECGGLIDHKARFTVNGWFKIKDIRKDWKKYDLEGFETDVMGWRPSGRGLVLDPISLDSCVIPDIKFTSRSILRVGIDWGARGMSFLVLVQESGNGKCEVVDSWYKEAPRDSDITDQLNTWKVKYGFFRVFADQSHPFQNDNLRIDHGFDLVEVNFNKDKIAGIGVLRNYFEKRMLFVASEQELLVDQLRNWHKDKNGNIRKEYDHGCDALLCAMIEKVEMSELVSAYDDSGVISDENVPLEYYDQEMEYYKDYGYSPIAPVYSNTYDEYLNDSEF